MTDEEYKQRVVSLLEAILQELRKPSKKVNVNVLSWVWKKVTK